MCKRQETTTKLKVSVGWPHSLGSSMSASQPPWRCATRGCNQHWYHWWLPGGAIEIHLQMRLLTQLKLPTSMLRSSGKRYTRSVAHGIDGGSLSLKAYTHPCVNSCISLVFTEEGYGRSVNTKEIWKFTHGCVYAFRLRLCICLSHW